MDLEMASPKQINLIKALAAQMNLDPNAVLAVAAQEGLGGGIGDAGTSFGPFQLHRGGALPGNVPLSKAHNWAWGRMGLKYALSRMASVAGGLHDANAIKAIVNRFERPANPAGEISRALASYGGQTPSAGVPAGGSLGGGFQPLGSAAVPALQENNSLMDALLRGETDLTGVIRERYASAPPVPLRSAVSPPNATPDLTGVSTPAELINEGTGGPTHSTGPHIHAAYSNPQALLAAIQLARHLGLHVEENPYVGSVSPVHSRHSYHYQTFPGLYSGKKLGKAIDVSGAKAQQFYKLLASVR